MHGIYYLFVAVHTCWSYSYYYDDYYDDVYWRQGDSRMDSTLDQSLNNTFFMSLEQYQVGATETSESVYPWIARVVHSRVGDKPHVCTAVCIHYRIFITAARCLYRVYYTGLIYQGARLQALAMVLPSNTTKQAFDDIGFIITDRSYKGPWPTVQLFDETNRTDDHFNWFAKLEFSTSTRDYKVVGYSCLKNLYRVKSAHRIYTLTELPVTVGIGICSQIMTTFGHIRGFYVPCYHSCSVDQFIRKDKECDKYHGVEGGALVHTRTEKLLGLATWGSVITGEESPVGFSVPNSVNFFQDFSCAKRIRDDNTDHIVKGYYQHLCKK